MGKGCRTYRQLLGQKAEDLAVEFLRGRGLQILLRNFRRRSGEIDIVAREGDDLIIVEVRARSSGRYGGAAASVDWRKQQRIARASHLLLLQHRELAKCRARFDVVTVAGMGDGAPRMRWIKHAFST